MGHEFDPRVGKIPWRRIEFGDFKEVTKVKWSHQGGTLIQHDWSPSKKRKNMDGSTQRKDHLRTPWEGGRLQAKEASRETKPAETLGFQPPELWENKLLWLKHPICGIYDNSSRLIRPPRGLSGDESPCQCGRCWFNTRVGKIPWGREWLPPPVFLPGRFHGQRSLAGYGLWGCKRVRHNWVTKQQQQRLTAGHRYIINWT